ncbi:YheC/YheD family protein [Niallia sp. SS-2023]|uniref:YheC/YheD family endospore coat-associated protein n=1 Tax=Niallia sp. SS-2023 TaxID=3051155 RepID=UPI00254E1911|nr:YheC/YheD family protein [Niallia sp. SS-2023]MDL0436806.1 YheC/YheD family protein [Niallia sp. SS-2023]
MKKLYSIEVINDCTNTIYLPADASIPSNLKRAAFGTMKVEAFIAVQKFGGNVIRISEDLIQALKIPPTLPILHVFYDKDVLYIGPLVGIFTSGFSSVEVKPIGERTIIFSKLLAVQNTAGVTAFLFGAQHIDWDKGTINGLFYHDGWKRFEVPFPDVIYDRIPNRRTESLPKIKKVKYRLQQEYMIPWYNPGFFNKLDIYERLLQENSIADFLPETLPFTSFSVVERMLSNYGHIYIKPKNGSLGKGIYQVIYNKKDENYYTRFKEPSGEKRLLKFDTLEKLIQHITAKTNINNLLVQQGIHLMRSEKKPIDFRVHTNKNKQGKWEVTAIAAKIAGAGSATTHMNSGGIVKSIDELLDVDKDKEQLKEKLINSALRISKTLEKYTEGTIGEIGFDIGVDRKGRVWLFEANSKPGRSIFKHSSLKKGDLLTRRMSLEYAIYLYEQSIKKPEDIFK